MTIPLGRSLPNASRDPPGRRPETTIAVPIRSCSRWGLPCHLRYRRRGALLPHHFNLAWLFSRRRSAFCCAFPGVASAGRYPAPCFRGARTFLPPSRYALRRAAIRPTDTHEGFVLTARNVNLAQQGGQNCFAFAIRAAINPGGTKMALKSLNHDLWTHIHVWRQPVTEDAQTGFKR
jgi:hypothetical protein